MKKVTTFITALTISFAGLSQNSEISIESYRNFAFGTPNSFGSFDNELIQLNDGSDQTGTKISLGVNYTYHLPNDWFVRMRPGFSMDNRNDKTTQNYDGEFGYEVYDLEADLRIKHTSLNLFAGFGKEIKLSERFSLMVGLDLGLIADLSNSVHYDVNRTSQYEANPYVTELESTYQREFAKYTRVGIMPIVSPKFHINQSFSISAELQYLGAISMTNGEEIYYYNEVQRDYDPSLVGEYVYNTDVKFNSKASMLSISKLSPLLRFSYTF